MESPQRRSHHLLKISIMLSIGQVDHTTLKLDQRFRINAHLWYSLQVIQTTFNDPNRRFSSETCSFQFQLRMMKLKNFVSAVKFTFNEGYYTPPPPNPPSSILSASIWSLACVAALGGTGAWALQGLGERGVFLKTSPPVPPRAVTQARSQVHVSYVILKENCYTKKAKMTIGTYILVYQHQKYYIKRLFTQEPTSRFSVQKYVVFIQYHWKGIHLGTWPSCTRWYSRAPKISRI